jgi:hypothetical protein
MRYAKVLGVGALGLALACSDTGGPNERLAGPVPTKPSFVVAGAGFTTINPAIDGAGTLCLNGPGFVNCNLYAAKTYVWTNGGPTNGANTLSPGTYIFAVLEPSGQNDANDGAEHNLSDTDILGGTGTTGGGDLYTNRTFTVGSTGQISSYGGTHTQYDTGTELLLRLFPYDDTSNNGGVYIMALCRIDLKSTFNSLDNTYDASSTPVTAADCKYDAFKAPTDDIVTPPGFPVISGFKYYDANLNGQRDQNEVGIPNWPINITDGVAITLYTGANGLWATDQLGPDDYNFQEQQAGTPWMQTGNTFDQTTSGATTPSGFVNSLTNFIYNITVADDPISNINFGNVCIGAGGGHTLGYWSNKNGEATMKDGGTLAPELALLVALNLRNANGTHFDPTTYAAFRTWLLAATATNMAYMLSAQLAAMELNVEAGFVSGSAIVYGGSTLGFVTINDLRTSANTELGLHGTTVVASADRTYQEQLKTALDQANNNLNFVQPTAATCPTPVFPN